MPRTFKNELHAGMNHIKPLSGLLGISSLKDNDPEKDKALDFSEEHGCDLKHDSDE